VVEVTALIAARDLFRFYHAGDTETIALRDVSLTVEAGEMVAVLGPSGSGKSTLLACVAGLDDPDGGMVTIVGHPISRRSEAEKAAIRARHIGVLFQSHNLIGQLTIRQNVELAQRLCSRPDPTMSERVLAEIGLSPRADAFPSQLSGGEIARAGLVVALANDPEVLLADEPSGEVDGETEATIVELLQQRARAGKAVVVVTHSDAVASAAGRVVRLRDGRVES
jgi:putative ABC transport system ATP-binding protein